ncbi:MAG: nucleotidyl transferase AbiEii/AbiGii toxin family protein [Polaromonas sp.]|uniref:nucleotidyl transferase AbiEii/AbiGii toxin family protein n=1 Tax=Polaromonas sp. TaxID=1869339 RepID=UPI002730C00C|nr:nucleotidyl transferase AbiEii/AbiGii toxin family protein [Polaromonas sp.]MDP2450650.1 nucleotidyl transferase AbiEii/AbiGii toxin family protein [Polaromonas sp.]MDP3248300.1 nucleotidyl transferase AbiEii/AbiGii toxin family protein [Polaromonas sp.]MDP3756134.1 nucleotidyl transferase AbiEii/AbiGii toxin family protein [Polaromonas sp.]
MSKDLAASGRARLLNVAKAEQSDFNGVLVRYALERLLYRLSQSAHADRFLLKGAMLFTLWYDMPHRPTRDVDLLGFGASDLPSIEQTFRDIVSVVVEDGIRFDPDSVTAEEIRKEAGYAGARVLISAELAGARVKTQVDVGFGDAVTPGPVKADYPVLLEDFPAPSLQTYPVYTVIAEKLHAITLLGMTNSRLKDYLDLSVLLEREALDADILATAIAATFSRRATLVPAELPLGLSDEFALDTSRQALWRAFLNKNQLVAVPLPELLVLLRARLRPALQQAALMV